MNGSALMLCGHPPGAGSGSSMRNRVAAEALRELFGRVDVVSFAFPGEGEFAEPGVHLVERPPAPSGPRAVAALVSGSAFYLPERDARLGERVRDLVAAGVLQDGYDLVWSHSTLMTRAAGQVGARARVLDIDNIAAAAAGLVAEGPGTDPLRRLYWRASAWAVGREERRRCDTQDRVLVTSADERDRLGAVRPPVVVVPNTVPPVTPADPAATDQVVLFVGTLDYGPNVDAVAWLADGIAPVIHARVPEARVVVAGRRPGPGVRAACARAGIELVPDAPSLEELYHSARVVIAPMRTGGGTGRIKVIEALAYGSAIVATHQAVEGLAIDTGGPALLADSADRLAGACAELLSDPARAGALGARAHARWRERHTAESAKTIVRNVVDDALAASPS